MMTEVGVSPSCPHKGGNEGRRRKPEDTKKLIDLAVSSKERTLGEQLRKDATVDGPQVHGSRIPFLPQQDFWSPVPQGDYLRSCRWIAI